jgi:hypothetical protein
MENLIEKAKDILDKYSSCKVECDGFSRIAHYLLKANDIDHKCYFGTVKIKHEIMYPHFWIKISNHIVDYRLKMWFKGFDVPNGIFLENNEIIYYGEEVNLFCSEELFKILIQDSNLL